MNNKTVASLFLSDPARIEGNPLLRDPQIQGHAAVREHFATSQEPAILQIPVGCGKTGLMSILPFGTAKGRVLIITPNLIIRDGVADALNVSDYDECFWRKAQVLGSFREGPFRAVLDGDANITDCHDAHFVVTNIHQLASSADRWLPNFPDDFFDLILVDEAHHNAAESWQAVFQRFPNARVVSLTATPFRSDGREVTGIPVYRYSFSEAMRRGYIKNLRVSDAQPAEIHFEYAGDTHKHTLAEVLELREEAWFRKGVALSRPTNETIVAASLEALDRLRTTGAHHQIVAAAMSINHAKDIASYYRERGYSAEVISSELPKVEKEEVLRKLRSNALDCIVQVNMLGEGFDWPQLSVAAIFRPYRSLAPYIQFIGRALRVLVQNDPFHADNEAWVVSHIGLQQDERWDDFTRFDQEDAELFRGSARGEDRGPREGGGGGRPRIHPQMRVVDELIEAHVTRSFLNEVDEGGVDAVLAEIERTLGIDPDELGLSHDELAGRLLQARRRKELQPRERIVQPQEHRKQLRRRLNEASRSVGVRVLQARGISPNSIDLVRYFPDLAPAANNIAAVSRLMQRQVNTGMGFPPNHRGELSTEQLESAIQRLDDFGDQVEQLVRSAQESRRA